MVVLQIGYLGQGTVATAADSQLLYEEEQDLPSEIEGKVEHFLARKDGFLAFSDVVRRIILRCSSTSRCLLTTMMMKIWHYSWCSLNISPLNSTCLVDQLPSGSNYNPISELFQMNTSRSKNVVGDFCPRKTSVFLRHGSSQYVYNVLACLSIAVSHKKLSFSDKAPPESCATYLGVF